MKDKSAETTLDVEQYISNRAKLWRASQIRSFFPLEHTPGIISLLAGKPNPATFPFEAITLSIKTDLPGEASYDVRIEHEELERALQYGMTGGLPDFVKWLQDFQCSVHGRETQSEKWSVVVGNGSQDLLTKVFQVLVNDGETILSEALAFPFAEGYFNLVPTEKDLECLRRAGTELPPTCTIRYVNTDDKGLDVDHLRSVLTGCGRDLSSKPKVLYTCPTGSNPRGATITEERKAEVLLLAKQHDFLILEDDAYAWLYYGDAPKPRSYFALEKEVTGEVGRVVRFDSFSKILSSGMRIGFMSAAQRICDLVVLNTANANLQSSSTTQTIALALLRSWGHQGLIAHCERVASFYKKKRDMFATAASRHLSEVATWTLPVAGMFLFIELKARSDGSRINTFDLIRTQATKYGILCVPGSAFMAPGSQTSCIRLSFSLADEPTADEACRRLRKCIDAARTPADPQLE